MATSRPDHGVMGTKNVKQTNPRNTKKGKLVGPKTQKGIGINYSKEKEKTKLVKEAREAWNDLLDHKVTLGAILELCSRGAQG